MLSLHDDLGRCAKESEDHPVGRISRILLLAFLNAFLSQASIAAEDCPLGKFTRWTDNFSFSGSSSSARAGEVVRVDFFLTLEETFDGFAGLDVVFCYDQEKLELASEPIWNPDLEAVIDSPFFFKLGGRVGPRRQGGGVGGVVLTNFDGEEFLRAYQLHTSIPLFSFYLRVKGHSGETTAIEFCDEEFVHPDGQCERNQLLYYPMNGTSLLALSTLHRPATIHILPGPPVNTELPPLPPPAKVYDEPPSAENAAIEFELRPSEVDLEARRMAFDFSITSSHEWSGYSLALDYPARYLRFSRIEQLARPGAVRFDDGMGWLGVVAAGSSRRLGREGERVRVARLHFDLSAEAIAAGAGELAVEFRPTPFHINWLQIRHRGGIAGSVPVSANVEPREARRAAIKLPLRVAAPGDVNLDERVDLSDAVSLLSSLFRGSGRVECPGASDFNADGRVNITDAVSILDWLYRAGAPAKARGVPCR